MSLTIAFKGTDSCYAFRQVRKATEATGLGPKGREMLAKGMRLASNLDDQAGPFHANKPRDSRIVCVSDFGRCGRTLLAGGLMFPWQVTLLQVLVITARRWSRSLSATLSRSIVSR